MKLYLVQWSQPFDPESKIRILVVDDFAAWEKRMKNSGRYVVFSKQITAEEAAELQSKYKPLISC